MHTFAHFCHDSPLPTRQFSSHKIDIVLLASCPSPRVVSYRPLLEFSFRILSKSSLSLSLCQQIDDLRIDSAGNSKAISHCVKHTLHNSIEKLENEWYLFLWPLFARCLKCANRKRYTLLLPERVLVTLQNGHSFGLCSKLKQLILVNDRIGPIQ